MNHGIQRSYLKRLRIDAWYGRFTPASTKQFPLRVLEFTSSIEAVVQVCNQNVVTDQVVQSVTPLNRNSSTVANVMGAVVEERLSAVLALSSKRTEPSQAPESKKAVAVDATGIEVSFDEHISWLLGKVGRLSWVASVNRNDPVTSYTELVDHIIEALALIGGRSEKDCVRASFYWPPFESGTLPGQTKSAARTILDELGIGEITPKSSILFFGTKTQKEYLQLFSGGQGNRNKESEDAGDWMIAPALSEVLDGGEAKRELWHLIKTINAG